MSFDESVAKAKASKRCKATIGRLKVVELEDNGLSIELDEVSIWVDNRGKVAGVYWSTNA